MIEPMPQTAVHCSTEAEFNNLLLKLEESGFSWPGGKKPTVFPPGGWSEYGAATCINIGENILRRGIRSYYENAGFTILPAKHFLLCPDCKGTKVYVGLNITEPCQTCKEQP